MINPGHFIPRECSGMIGGWRKNLCTCQGSNSRHPVCSQYRLTELPSLMIFIYISYRNFHFQLLKKVSPTVCIAESTSIAVSMLVAAVCCCGVGGRCERWLGTVPTTPIAGAILPMVVTAFWGCPKFPLRFVAIPYLEKSTERKVVAFNILLRIFACMKKKVTGYWKK